jgi:thiol:disulfide interchange protein DsbD
LRNVAELDAALRTAGRPVMLDFYADWCVSCKEMERFTFTDAAVQQKLRGALLLKADVTANNADDRELLKRFGLFGPPGTIFFDPSGREVAAARIVGFQDAPQFLKTLQSVGL